MQRAELLESRLEQVKSQVEDPKSQLTQKEAVKLITDLTEDISAAVISYWVKDEMRNRLKAVKKAIDDKDRARKAALLGEVVDKAKAVLVANPDLPYLVYQLDACAQNKALDGALKQVGTHNYHSNI